MGDGSSGREGQRQDVARRPAGEIDRKGEPGRGQRAPVLSLLCDGAQLRFAGNALGALCNSGEDVVARDLVTVVAVVAQSGNRNETGFTVWEDLLLLKLLSPSPLHADFLFISDGYTIQPRTAIGY